MNKIIEYHLEKHFFRIIVHVDFKSSNGLKSDINFSKYARLRFGS